MGIRQPGVVWLPNRRDFYPALGVASGLALGILASVPLMHPPLTYLLGGMILSILVTVGVFVVVGIFRVGIGTDSVNLRKVIGGLVIRREEVEMVVLDPPVGNVSERIRWWAKSSALRIFFRQAGRPPMRVYNLEEGLKLRIARVLDPHNHPGDPLESVTP